MTIDIDKLRKDMLDNCYALYFASDIVAALAETFLAVDVAPIILNPISDPAFPDN